MALHLGRRHRSGRASTDRGRTATPPTTLRRTPTSWRPTTRGSGPRRPVAEASVRPPRGNAGRAFRQGRIHPAHRHPRRSRPPGRVAPRPWPSTTPRTTCSGTDRVADPTAGAPPRGPRPTRRRAPIIGLPPQFARPEVPAAPPSGPCDEGVVDSVSAQPGPVGAAGARWSGSRSPRRRWRIWTRPCRRSSVSRPTPHGRCSPARGPCLRSRRARTWSWPYRPALVDTSRLADCFVAIDYFEHIGLPFVVAVNQFEGRHNVALTDVRAATDVEPSVPSSVWTPVTASR